MSTPLFFLVLLGLLAVAWSLPATAPGERRQETIA